MPVNLLPILIPLFLVWIACLGLLFRWRLSAGISFIGASLTTVIVIGANLDLERQFDEQMPYSIVGSGKGAFAEFTTGDGNQITVGDQAILQMLRSKADKRAQVRMKAWYDFGRFRSYNVISVEGQRPVQ